MPEEPQQVVPVAEVGQTQEQQLGGLVAVLVEVDHNVVRNSHSLFGSDSLACGSNLYVSR